MPVVGEAIVRVRVVSAGMDNAIRDEVRRQLGSPDIDRDAENTGRRIGQRVRRGVENDGRRGGLSRLFAIFGSDSASKFGDAFNLGIGRARMGKGIISILVAMGPSVISAGAAMGTALAAEILTAISAIGPGLIGLGGVLAAGFATALVNFGLLAAAFSSGVDGLDDLKDAAKDLVKELGTPIAQTMLPGMKEAVQTLRDAVPQLNDLLSETGQKFGDIAKNAAATLVSAENMTRWRDILATNNSFLDKFGVGLNNLITSFLILLDAAKPFIDYLGDGLVKFSDWLKNLLEAKEATGELSDRAQRYLDKWQQLWQTIKDFSAGLSNMFKAIAPVGGQLADSLGNVAQRFRDWTGDTENQERMTQFFQKAHDLSSKIFEILGKLFKAGGNAFMSADFTNLYAVLDTIADKLAPAIAQIWNQIQEAMGPHLVVIVDNLATAFGKIADSGVIGTIAGMVGTLLEKLSALVSSDIGSWVLGLGVSWALFGGILKPVVSLLSALVSTFGAVGAAVAAAVAFFVLMWQNSENLRTAIGHLVEIIGGKFAEVWEKIGPRVTELWEEIQKLAGAIGDRLAPIIEAIGPIIGNVFGFIGDALAGIIDIAKNVIGFIADVFSGDWAGAWDHIKSLFVGVWDTIKSLFGDALDFIGSIFSGWWDLFSGIWVSVWNALPETVRNILGSIGGFFAGIWNDITSGFSEMAVGFRNWWNNLWDWVGQKFSAAWNWVKDTATSAGSAVYNAIYDFGNWIKKLWDDLWSWVGQTLSTAWNGILSFLSGIWNDLVSGFEEMGTGFRDWWNNLWDWVGQKLSAVWNGFLSVVTTVGSTVYNAIYDFGNWIKQLWDELWTWVGQRLSDAWNGFISFVTGIWDQFTTQLEETGEGLKAWWNNLWTWVGETASAIWNGITAALSAIWQGIVNVVHFLFDPWVDFFSQLWSTIMSGISSAWSSITSWLSSTWESIKSTAASIWGSVIGLASSIWGSVTGAIRDVVSAIGSWLSGIWNDIKSTASSIWNSVIGVASSAWSSVRDAIIQPIIDAYNKVVGWIGSIKDAVSSALSWLSDQVSAANDKLQSILNTQAQAGQVGVGVNTSGDTAGVFGGGAAEGGMFPAIPGGWMVNVSEGGRDERIEPLDSQGLSRRDKALISHIVSQMSVSSGSNGDTHVTVMLDGRQLAGVVSGVVTNQLDSQAREIRKRRRTSA